jgi:hypothetical protein
MPAPSVQPTPELRVVKGLLETTQKSQLTSRGLRAFIKSLQLQLKQASEREQRNREQREREQRDREQRKREQCDRELRKHQQQRESKRRAEEQPSRLIVDQEQGDIVNSFHRKRVRFTDESLLGLSFKQLPGEDDESEPEPEGDIPAPASVIAVCEAASEWE